MSPLSKEWQYPAIMGAVAIFFLLLFYLDYSRTIDIGNREAIGYITYKNNRVQRKFEDQVVWSNLENNSALTNRDTIRSENLSDAVIHLNDGTIIKIDENSMFFLDLSGAKPKLSFHTGAVQIQQGEDGQTELVIQTGDRTINVASGSDLKIESSTDEELSLIMQKGNASIQTKDGTHALGADQRARLSDEGVTVREVKLKLVEPANQSVVPVQNAGSGRVPLRWQLREKFTGLKYEVSRSRGFEKIEKSGAAGGSGAEISMPPGNYYWRLTGKSQTSGIIEYSEVRKLSVVKNTPVRLTTPANGTRMSYVLAPPLVGFAWSRNDLANQYILEIAEDAGFQKELKSYPLKTNSYSVSGLDAGRYFWRVRSKSLAPGVADQVSGVSNLTIVQKENFDVPQPGAPTAGAPLAKEDAQEGVTFAWRAPPELNLFQVQISRDPSFQTVIVDKEVSRSYFENPVSQTGVYYWRVRGRSGDKQSSFSSSTRFEVLERSEIAARQAGKKEAAAEPAGGAADATTLAAREREESARKTPTPAGPTMKAIAPVNSKVNVSGARSIGFRWKAARGARGYRFRLYRGAGGGRKLVLEKNLNQTKYVLSDFSKLDVGTFSWEVQAKPLSNASEKISARFTITTDSRLNDLRPEDIEFISPDTIYKE
ncbi:MAG: FecR family protein [bacterium]|nr:FecR family protein [bacterium]